MLANRISYFMNLHGPSYTIDTACSSSMFALDQGYRLIRNGTCDAVIVGGSNLCLHPYVSLQFARLGKWQQFYQLVSLFSSSFYKEHLIIYFIYSIE